jgi:antitoxin component YwqK of YwqJK toxin-antitoxin module
VKVAEANWKQGKKHGYWYVWDHSGVKRYELFYQNGEKSGTWFMWNEKGELESKREY